MNNFNTMSLEQLLALNKEICAAISARRTADASVKVLSFAKGDKVYYKGSTKTAGFYGTVTNVLRVNVDVLADNGRPWRIHATCLQKV